MVGDDAPRTIPRPICSTESDPNQSSPAPGTIQGAASSTPLKSNTLERAVIHTSAIPTDPDPVDHHVRIVHLLFEITKSRLDRI